MKNLILTLALLGGVVLGAVLFFKRQTTTTPTPAPVANPTSEPAASVTPEKFSKPKAEALVPAPPAPVTTATSVDAGAKPDDTINPIRKAVDDLLSAKNGKEKHELFQQLVKAGQIDAAIAELKQRAADNPNDSEIPTTLGEAMLNKLRDLRETGKGDINDFGILAMQADQSFNAALKIDPNNWEANYVKAASMYYWPADPVRDADTAQRLSNLIDQQEKAATQAPEFVQTYLTLGNQYLKMNQPDKALATWQLGLQKFPNDPALQKKVSGQ